MFYELLDYNYEHDYYEPCLINLNEILQINQVANPVKYRNDINGKVYEIYKIKVYYTGKGNEWGFYFRTKSDQKSTYDNLKVALLKNKLLMEKEQVPNPFVDDDVHGLTNIFKKDVNLLEEALHNQPSIDIPGIKICE